jgi:predicted nuclease with TOPRIM domain|tara:strand:- start:870 stop:1166 length:297 start_codon:yes stop_codon:yes gene_type:complete
MQNETIISLVVGLIGALGLKEVWNIWKKKIDNSTQIKSEIRKDNKQRIRELEDQVNELRERIENLLLENADIKVNVARLEERILLTAKNRIKNKNIDE